MKVASTRDIIKYLEEYEKRHGVGAVLSIGSVCSGCRNVEYIFYIEDRNKNEVKVEIPTIKKETLFSDMSCYDCKLWEKGRYDGTCVHYINNDCPYGYHE